MFTQRHKSGKKWKSCEKGCEKEAYVLEKVSDKSLEKLYQWFRVANMWTAIQAIQSLLFNSRDMLIAMLMGFDNPKNQDLNFGLNTWTFLGLFFLIFHYKTFISDNARNSKWEWTQKFYLEFKLRNSVLHTEFSKYEYSCIACGRHAIRVLNADDWHVLCCPRYCRFKWFSINIRIRFSRNIFHIVFMNKIKEYDVLHFS